MNHVTHPLSSADISIFSLKIDKFCYIKKCRYSWVFYFNFFELINVVITLPAKMASPGLLIITVFGNKSYDIILPVDDVIKKFYHLIQIIFWMCSCDQSLVTLAFLWEKLSQPQFYKDLTRFSEGWSWFKFKIWEWH